MGPEMTAKKTCLVVDDSPVIREIAARILSDLGLEAPEAENAAAAVEYCEEKGADAVLLDWDLPSMGALDFLRGVSQLEPDKRPVIILCATENDPQQFTLAKAAGAAHHVLKPFDRESLETKLQDVGLLEGSGQQVRTIARQ
jgi:two-component system chemotaxis response regulator CheY